MNSSPKRRNSLVFLYTGYVFSTLSLLFFLGFSFDISAQSSRLSDYLILAGDASCNTPGSCGVNIGPNNEYSGGIIGSYNGITSQGGLIHTGEMYGYGYISLGGGNQVTGDIYGSNEYSNTGNILLAGSGSVFGGNITVNGDIFISSGTVAGEVSHPSGFSYSGPVPGGGEVTENYSYNDLPLFPPVSNFPAAGNGKLNNSQTITPGSYGDVTLKGNRTLTFDGIGDYIFSSVENKGSSNKFVFDFKNQSSGSIRLLVHGDVDLGKMEVVFPNGGDASRVFMEVHGNGSTSGSGNTAWYISGGSIGAGQSSQWFGTVWAPNGGIEIGGGSDKSTLEGALFSQSFVNLNNNLNLTHVPYVFCINAVNIQISTPDTITCRNPIETLNLTTNASNPQILWTTDDGLILSGATTANPEVVKEGTYIVTVTDGYGCTGTDSVFVAFLSCIRPYYPAPEGGKTFELIGSELTQYNVNANYQDSLEYIFKTQNDSVYIEIIVVQGQYQNTLSVVTGPGYGLTNIIDNGPATQVITGLYPRQNLLKLDSLPLLIRYVRPLFEGILKGAATSQGDELLRAPFVRGGYDISGEGVKIGVLSNSFNTQPGNPAGKDVQEEDLPGAGNTLNTNPVSVLKEYPFGVASDEGRAMLQIIHDIAPKAELSFRTGFITAGDFAQGILDLAADSCDIIVDDIAYITESFLSDGIVAQTVNAVNAAGVTYLSSAGNFGDNAYGSTLNPVPAPAEFDAGSVAHDFGGGDIYQSISLTPGSYVMVLQWQDSVYSIGQTNTGTQNDLDLYLTDGLGNTLFGFNRPNLGGDPIEVMPFTVTDSAESNILIVRAQGTDNVPFKLIVFRGDLTFNEFNTGKSTVVGHPNAAGALAVGAANYFDLNQVAPYSSLGGTPVGGVVRQKPEFSAPDGVNTTVDLGGGFNTDIEGDNLPNFFGTSAAAPHAAAVAALIKSAQIKFEGYNTSPDSIKSILMSTAIDLGNSGFDYESGAGLIRADRAIASFANPTPYTEQMRLKDSTLTPGIDTVTISIEGNYFTGNTKVVFRDTDTLNSVLINSNTLEAEVPPFNGNPAIRAYEVPITSSLLDGGFGDTLLFSDPIKKKVQVFVDDTSKLYGASMPRFSFRVLVDSVDYLTAGYTLAELGLDNLNVFTLANNLSNVGVYRIRIEQRSIDISNPFDYGLTESFIWELNEGQLLIEKMPLTISVKDTTLPYGVLISDFDFQYSYPDSLVDPSDSLSVYDSIFINHTANILDAVILVNAEAKGEYLARGRAIVNADVEKRTYMASSRAIVNARPYANPSTSMTGIPDTALIVDISAESIFDYVDGPDTITLSNAYTAEGSSKEYQASSRAIVNALDFAVGSVLINAVAEDGSRYQASSRAIVNALPLVNAQVDSEGEYLARGRAIVNDYPLVNGVPVNQDSSEINFVLDEADVDTTLQDSLFAFFPLNMIIGNDAGSRQVVPAPLYNPNFNITYLPGTLTITKDTLELSADSIMTTYGDLVPFDFKASGYEYVDADSSVINGPPTYNLIDSLGQPVATTNIDAGEYIIVPDSLELIEPSNYEVKYISGYLAVGPASLDVTADALTTTVYGDAYNINVTYNGFKYDDSESASVVSGPDIDLSIASVPYIDPEVDAGTYDVGLSNLLLVNQSNYDINYYDGVLAVTKADLIATARDTFRTYGFANPTFSIDYSGFKYLDDVGEINEPTASTNADQTSIVNTYSIDLNNGSADNYNLIKNSGTLTVNPADISVTADDALIFAGDPLPSFSYTITGDLNPADMVTGPSYTVNPGYTNLPGVYDIVPSGLTITNSGSYNVNYEDGTLYVNPTGNQVKNVKPSLVCVEGPLTNHPSGFSYIANYAWENTNAYAIYIPAGPDNRIITSGSYSGTIPEFFPPGSDTVQFFFDGTKMTWEVTTDNAAQKTSASSDASSTSNKCGGKGKGNGKGKNKSSLSRTSSEELLVYPNPTTGIVNIVPEEDMKEPYQIVVFDVSGRLVNDKVEFDNSKQLISLDLGKLSSGMYLIQLSNSQKTHYIRMAKDE